MTTRICDKCKGPSKELTETKEEYGNYELCDKCLKEINGISSKIHDEWYELLKLKRQATFLEWINAPITVKKKSLFQRIFS